ncbi:ATP-dependent endonuclease [Microbispora bryophytorum]|uniref:ATP-dependent nuclease n=1 Tax=Microbispora bryophytorum TaxID=1460882 RepID=UPI00371F49AD
MRYKQFKFKNFKGIKALTLDLNEGATTLIGLNESGKTTILEAIFSFSYGAEAVEALNPGMETIRNPESWIPVSERANFNDVITVSATIALDEHDQSGVWTHAWKNYDLKLDDLPSEFDIKAEYVIKNSRQSNMRGLTDLRFTGTQGKQRKSRTFTSDTPEWQGIMNYMISALPRIWYFPDFLFEFPERFVLAGAKSRFNTPFDTSEKDESSSVDARMADRNRIYRTTFENIVERLGYGATLDTHVVERLKSRNRADHRSLDALLLDMSRLVTETVFDGWNRILGRAPAAQEVQINADFDSDGAACLELKIKGPDGYYDLSERSLGFRWFFMFLLMTSFQKESKSGTKPLILLDEPASNLHSSAQAELLKSFAKLTETADLIYTTHSHHLIDVRWLDSAYVIKNSALDSLDFGDYLSTRMGARTSITATRYRKFVAESPDHTSYIQPVLDLLNYHPSILEPTPNVILVEGKSDFFAMRYMAEVINVPTDLRMVPGGGAGSLDALIRLHIGWGKSFLVLLDGDAEGKKQRERYEREFGPLILNRCVMLPDICRNEKVLELEDLFEPHDKSAIVSEVFPQADTSRRITKKSLQQAIVELYARRQPVAINSSTIKQFCIMFEALRKRLNDA